MSQTRLFVSSTCYDLIHIRQALNTSITRLGHLPVMSEFASFRVDPQLSSIENCRNNVRNNADVFVLIIGGRRGSLDKATAKSIVNLEYDAAVQEGLDIYVFVDQAVLNLLPIWSKNRELDLTPTVDSNDVMAFVDHIREQQHWTFPFAKESDISDILSLQLSGQLRELLAKKRSGHLDATSAFRNESDDAKLIVSKREPLWEYLLTAELLEKRLLARGKELADVQAGRVLGPHRSLRGRDYMAWAGDKFPEVTGALAKIKSVLEEDITSSWGALGEAGDPKQILEAITEMDRALVALIALESDIFRTHGPEATTSVREALLGMSSSVVDPLRTVPQMLLDAVERARGHKGEDGPLTLNLNVKFEFAKATLFDEALKNMQMRMTQDDW